MVFRIVTLHMVLKMVTAVTILKKHLWYVMGYILIFIHHAEISNVSPIVAPKVHIKIHYDISHLLNRIIITISYQINLLKDKDCLCKTTNTDAVLIYRKNMSYLIR